MRPVNDDAGRSFFFHHLQRAVLTYRLASAASGTACSLNNQRVLLKANGIFRTASPAGTAQNAFFAVEREVRFTDARERFAQHPHARPHRTGRHILLRNMNQRAPRGIDLFFNPGPEIPGRFTASTEDKVKPGKRRHPGGRLLCFKTDSANALHRVPEKKFVKRGRAPGKWPQEGISLSTAFLRRDADNRLCRADKQAVTAFNTAAFINPHAGIRKREHLHGARIRTGTTGDVSKAATDACIRNVHRRKRGLIHHQPILKKTKRSMTSPTISSALPASIVPRVDLSPPAAKQSIPRTETHSPIRCTVRSCSSICSGA